MSAIELNDKGIDLYKSGMYKEAIEWFRKSLAINPNDATVWNNAGNAYFRLSMYGDAVQCHAKAIPLNPNNASTWAYQGNACCMLGEVTKYNNELAIAMYEIAITCYDKSLSINPNDALTLKNRSYALKQLNGRRSQGTAYPQPGIMSKRVETTLGDLGMNGIIGNI
jgi:tetratricopeptide (TPR) repeat protein